MEQISQLNGLAPETSTAYSLRVVPAFVQSSFPCCCVLLLGVGRWGGGLGVTGLWHYLVIYTRPTPVSSIQAGMLLVNKVIGAGV